MRGFVVLLLFAMLSGCAAPAGETLPSGTDTTPVLNSEKMQASMVESAARPLLEEEILWAYERAVRVYEWFDLAPMPTTGETAEAEGQTWLRVDMEGVESLEDLRTYLRSVFTQELTDRLLNSETSRMRYREIDGKLYVSGAARERDHDTGSIRVETEQLGEVEYSVNVLVDRLDADGETVAGVESWSFPYSFVEDRWVFTDFQLVY